LTFVIFGLTTQPGQTAWLKAYSPGDGVPAISVLKSPQGSFYLVGKKDSKQFAAKLDTKGHFKWGKLSISPFRIDSNSLTLKPPFTHMFSPPDTLSPFIWGKVSQDDKNGTIKKLYAKTFAKPLDGKFALVPHTNDNAKTDEYVINGSLNSAVRNGPNIPGGDIAIAKVNLGNGKLSWSHIFGFDLGGSTPVADSFPWVTKSHGNYFFSRPMTLTDPTTGNFTTFTVVGKLSGANGNLMGTPIMFDGVPAVHVTLQDGSVIVYSTVFNPTTSGSDLVIVKLDNNLSFLWGKRYGSASAAAYSFSLSTGFPELADGTIEVVGFHVISPSPRVLRPITVHISAVDGSVVVQKEFQFGAKDSMLFVQTAPKEGNTPTLFDVFSGATDSIVSPGLRDIVYGKLDDNLSPLWVKSITGAAILNSQVVYPSKLFPRDNATTYTIEGITQLGSTAQACYWVRWTQTATSLAAHCYET
jgi:hypothetical protein